MSTSTTPAPTRQRAATRPDAGFTLTEVLVAIVLMGLTVIPLMLSGVISVRTSGISRDVARVETVLANAADRINRAPEGCNYDNVVQAAALSEGWSAGTVSVSYSYYEPATSPTQWGTWVAGACPGGQRPQGLVQRITIEVTSPTGNVQRSLVVVKSDV